MPGGPQANLGAAETNNWVAGFRICVKFGSNVAAWFTECSGLTVERGTLEVSEGGVNDHVTMLPQPVKPAHVTLKRGLADLSLWQWFSTGLYDCKIERRAVTIILFSADHTLMKQWSLTACFPIKWQGPDLKTDSNQIAIETFELVHQGMTVTDWISAS
jgi:phage tail-like protein